MKLLFLFLDGVGLGQNEPALNPFTNTPMPNLERLLGGHKLIANTDPAKPAINPINTELASLLVLDARLGVEGLPQSATGQATLFTGVNFSAKLGYHEGPKPTLKIIELLGDGTLLTKLKQQGKTVAFLNAFPPRYFESIEAGYRIPGVISLSMQLAGIHLKTLNDLYNGRAISADFTAEGWRSHLGYRDTPILSLAQAGRRLKELADTADLSIFEYWLSDLAGHHQDMEAANDLLVSLDDVLGGLLEVWDNENGLVLLTSDHGNLEDLSTRRHTLNDVPLLLIGSRGLREQFINGLITQSNRQAKLDLSDVTMAILKFLNQAR